MVRCKGVAWGYGGSIQEIKVQYKTMTDQPYEIHPAPQAIADPRLVRSRLKSRARKSVGGTLGLPDADMERHIAYDIGARGVTLALAEALGATAILSRFSRLVIDPNRGDDDPTQVMRLYDGTIIAANAHLTEAEVAARRNRIYRALPRHNFKADRDTPCSRDVTGRHFHPLIHTPTRRAPAPPMGGRDPLRVGRPHGRPIARLFAKRAGTLGWRQ